MKKIYFMLACLALISTVSIAQNNEIVQPEEFVNTSKSANLSTQHIEARDNYNNNNSLITTQRGGSCGVDQDFEGGSFPATWTNITYNANENWVYDPANGNPDGCMTISYDLSQQNESLITPIIDFTSIPNATLKFDWLMSYYWGVDPYDNYDLIISISADGVNWIDVWTEADYGGEFDTYAWYTTNLDLSTYSSLSSAVLRFNYSGADGAAASFDNISLCSAQNDLRVTSVLMGDVINDYAYSQIPVSQTGEIISGVIMQNVGGNTLTNISLEAELYSYVDGANVSVGTIAGPAILAVGASDTVWVSTGYTPTMVDTLAQIFTASADQTDATPADNEGIQFLLTTEDTWAHDFEFEDYFAYGYASGGAAGSGGFEMGADYLCQNSGATITAVDFPLGDGTTAQTVTIKIYEIDANVTLVSSSVYDILPGDLSVTTINFINVMLDTPVPMVAGNVYRASVAIEGGDDGYIIANNIDDGDGGQALYVADDATWYNWTGLTTAMRLKVSSVVDVAENEGLTSLEVFPNPATDNINVNFMSEFNDVVTINVVGVDGKLVHATTISAAMGQVTKVVLDASNLTTGVYSIQLLGENISTVQRVVVQ
jgi:hypothetical protein